MVASRNPATASDADSFHADMLDEFDDDKTHKNNSEQQPQIDEEWARMLQEGMADLLKDVDQSVCPPPTTLYYAQVLSFPSRKCRICRASLRS
jgi:hypothetical protein